MIYVFSVSLTNTWMTRPLQNSYRADHLKAECSYVFKTNMIGPLITQEAQLPLRNRASAMHFFEAKLLFITVMTYNCV